MEPIFTQATSTKPAARAVQLVIGVQIQGKHQRAVQMGRIVKEGQSPVLFVRRAINAPLSQLTLYHVEREHLLQKGVCIVMRVLLDLSAHQINLLTTNFVPMDHSQLSRTLPAACNVQLVLNVLIPQWDQWNARMGHTVKLEPPTVQNALVDTVVPTKQPIQCHVHQETLHQQEAWNVRSVLLVPIVHPMLPPPIPPVLQDHTLTTHP